MGIFTMAGASTSAWRSGMAFVRVRGSQLAIVHGVRDAATCKVDQLTLHTFYARDELSAILGEAADTLAPGFTVQLEAAFPSVRFDWCKLRHDLERSILHLPVTYGGRDARLAGSFALDLAAIARQLVLADVEEHPDVWRTAVGQMQGLMALEALLAWRLDHLA